MNVILAQTRFGGVTPMKWYKRDPAAALEGMLGLTIEERGAYNALIDLIYARAPLHGVTDHLVCKALGCRPQVWQRLKAALMAKGKVWENPPGNLLCNRVVSEVVSSEFRTQNMVRLGQVSALKRNEINALRDGVWQNCHPTATLETPTPRFNSTSSSFLTAEAKPRVFTRADVDAAIEAKRAKEAAVGPATAPLGSAPSRPPGTTDAAAKGPPKEAKEEKRLIDAAEYMMRVGSK